MIWIILIIAIVIIAGQANTMNKLRSEITQLRRELASINATVSYTEKHVKKKAARKNNGMAIRDTLGLGDFEDITQEHIAHFQDKKIDSDLLQPDLEHASKDSPFYNKKTVVTGDFDNFTRQEIAEELFRLGADINTAVSKKTHFVIVGENPGPAKMQKVNTLIAQGVPIVVLTEHEFINMSSSF